jgi:putative aldouronate transport system permease protein
MRFKRSRGEIAFDWLNASLLTLVGLLAVYPFIYIVLLSFSTAADVARGGLLVLPRDFSFGSYDMILHDPWFLRGFANSLFRTVLGVAATLLMTALAAYPLSRPNLPWRRQIVFYILFTMLFSGGLVPKYLLLRNLGLIDNRLVLVLPLMLTAFNIIILKNFFQQIPPSYEEAAKIDGASDLAILFRIFLPLSKPALATIALWTAVIHWNAWFDAMIFITSNEKQVVQIFLQRIVIENSVKDMQFGTPNFNEQLYTPDALKAAVTVVTVLPILAVYPFVQRYFVKGIQLGGVKE